MDYNVELTRIETVEGIMWVATCPTLQGVTGGGVSAQQALETLEVQVEEMLNFLRDEGEPIPEAELMQPTKEYSGRVTYRPGKRLHREIFEQAELNDVSINTFISDAVSSYIGETRNSFILENLVDEVKNMQKSINKHTREIQNLGRYNPKAGDSTMSWTEMKKNPYEFNSQC